MSSRGDDDKAARKSNSGRLKKDRKSSRKSGGSSALNTTAAGEEDDSFVNDLSALKVSSKGKKATPSVDTSDSATKKRKENSKVRIRLGDLTHQNVGQVKAVNRAVFPVSYGDQFYKDLVANQQLTKLAFMADDMMVGSVSTRVEPGATTADGSPAVKLYIFTLGVLAPYRGLGVGSRLLTHVLEDIVPRESKRLKKPIVEVYVHVQQTNEQAQALYKRFQFVAGDLVPNYYKRIECTTALLMYRRFTDKELAQFQQWKDDQE